MGKPASKIYAFSKLLSQNDLCQSWRARIISSARQCLVKTPVEDSPLGVSTAVSILTESHRCQKLLHSTRVVSSRNKSIEAGRLYVQYPWLEPSVWRALTPEVFWSEIESVCRQVCLAIDYVHLLGLVHCDLKFSNFMVNANGAKPVVVLVDLDFLCPIDSKPNAKVFGTPRHIAPEVLANDRVNAQSDNYSLGVSLRDYLQACPASGKTGGRAADGAGDKLAALADRLTEQDYVRRPRFLTSALHEHGLTESGTFDADLKKLLSSVLLSRYRVTGADSLSTLRGLKKFVSDGNKIIGLHDDVLDGLASVHAVNRRAAFGVFRAMLRMAGLERQADYWHITLDEDSLQGVYTLLERHHRPSVGIAAREGSALDGEPATCLVEEDMAKAQELRQQGHLERSYLVVRNCLRLISEDRTGIETAIVESVLAEAGSLARSLNRLGEAAQHLARLLEIRDSRAGARPQLLHDLASLNIKLGRFAAARQLLDRGLHDTEAAGEHELRLRLLRLEAWLLIMDGDYRQAGLQLSSILATAIKRGLFETVVMAHYTSGVLHWRKGDFEEAERHLSAGFELAQSKHLLPQTVPVISTLSALYSELAEYDNAVKYGKLAVKVASSPEHLAALPSVCLAITFAYTRLGEYQKSEHWLQRYLNMKMLEDSKKQLLVYYLNYGFLQSNRGDHAGAKELWHKALELADRVRSPKHVGKIYHCLAESAFFEGDTQACDSYLAKARPLFEEIDDRASLAELDLIALLEDIYYHKTDRHAELLSQARTLIRYNCRYYAVLCVFHLLMQADDALRPHALQVVRPLVSLIGRSGPPLFRAVSCLLGATGVADADTAAQISAWKEVFRILLGADSRFLAALVGVKVGRLYAKTTRGKHAKKFFLQSLRLLETLGNDYLSKSIQLRLEEVSVTADNQERLVDSFHSVSLILREIKNHKESIQRLVQFAVDQTGAERGVLLLKRQDSSDLYIGAAVNCDEQSLTDIMDISATLPRRAARELVPLVIENALSDRRTREYQSIVYHNILSVVCIPLTDGEELLGVLYLDHHSIPALFDKQDLTYIQSIANFIAVTLTTIQDYKSLNLTNVELIKDLNRLGNQRSFITRDPSMIRLFEKLPQIARTTAPVLIMGESGTGKEILCHTVHDLSQRCDKALIKLNCAAIASTLIEGELFGVARSTATGVAERDGKFAAADGGTLYLDEIGDMPLEVQAKVLRVLEYQQFEKVGSNRPTYTDIRFIYATNKNLVKMVKAGTFREDLYYRINTIAIEIPPLRERPDDVPRLLEHFTRLMSAGRKPPRFSSTAVEALISYAWPGNVRELRNLVERCCILHPGATVSAATLPEDIQDSGRKHGQRKGLVAAVEIAKIREGLNRSNWNQSQAAKLLDIPLSTLRRKITKHGINKGI
ncbi:MAG TPA: sigma 54-interacting transcriptional regulator [Acidobacteriota bacterium]|nr:sigma 54-interacting transcriptional regulator [Acidobacteriota bacterium]